MIHFNCRSLLRHIDELRFIFTGNHPLVIAISESWVNDTVVDSEVSISGYQIFRLDRSHGRKGGGVAIYLVNQSGFKFTRRLDLVRSYELVTKNIHFAVLIPSAWWTIFCIKPQGIISRWLFWETNCDCLKSELKQTERMQHFNG